jgi:aminodeoxyfutalosine deaminase
MDDNNYLELLKLPKSDLHVHLEGTVTVQLLHQLANKNNIDILAPVEINGNLITIPDFKNCDYFALQNFHDFIGIYLKISQSIKTTEDIITVARHYAASCKEQSINYSEIYFSPTTFRNLNTKLEPLFEGLVEATRVANEEYGTYFKWIFDIVRNSSIDGMEVVELALSARARGVDVVAIGLAGLEKGFPASPYKRAFEKAKSLGFNTLAHAGETAGTQSIWETIKELNPSRIGHGIKATEDLKLMDYLAKSQIPLEVCPCSNVALGITSADNHPLRQMIESGLNVIICSDDPGIFGKSLTDNYAFALTNSIGFPELKKIAAGPEKF